MSLIFSSFVCHREPATEKELCVQFQLCGDKTDFLAEGPFSPKQVKTVCKTVKLLNEMSWDIFISGILWAPSDQAIQNAENGEEFGWLLIWLPSPHLDGSSG